MGGQLAHSLNERYRDFSPINRKCRSLDLQTLRQFYVFHERCEISRSLTKLVFQMPVCTGCNQFVGYVREATACSVVKRCVSKIALCIYFGSRSDEKVHVFYGCSDDCCM